MFCFYCCKPVIASLLPGTARFFRKDFRGWVVSCTVMLNCIVVIPPILDFVVGIIHSAPTMLMEALIANLSIEVFNIGILTGFSRLDKLVDNFFRKSMYPGRCRQTWAIVINQVFVLYQFFELMSFSIKMSRAWSGTRRFSRFLFGIVMFGLTEHSSHSERGYFQGTGH